MSKPTRGLIDPRLRNASIKCGPVTRLLPLKLVEVTRFDVTIGVSVIDALWSVPNRVASLSIDDIGRAHALGEAEVRDHWLNRRYRILQFRWPAVLGARERARGGGRGKH